MANNGNVNHTELIWSGKYTEEVKLSPKRPVDKISLPFQTIEVIDEPREDTENLALFDQKKEGWRNRLIWGDNKLVLSSLLKKYVGRVKLIYIDPPFDVGADFSISVKVGDEEITKEPSILEEKAYRDTWGKGADSYLQMMYERLVLMRDLLADDGSIYAHCDYRLAHYIRCLLDEVFGKDFFLNEIIWQSAVGDTSAKNKKFIKSHDTIYIYTKGNKWTWNDIYQEYSEASHNLYRYSDANGQYRLVPIDNPGGGGYNYSFGLGEKMPANGYRMPKETALKWLEEETLIVKKGKVPSRKQYKSELGVRCKDVWIDISSSVAKEYPTQKPEALLERIIKASSNPDDIIADFFCGSGATGYVAERLGRKWIMCDLGRFAIHTSRKRLMELQRILKDQGKPYSAFEILNLGKYERQYWQTKITKSNKKNKDIEYIEFIIKLYKAEVLQGLVNLHGKKEGHVVHVGAVDAPVTTSEIVDAVEECRANKLNKLDILGWEWEMSVNEEAIKNANSQGVQLRLLQIPKEVMEQQAIEKGDVKFFELNHMAIDVEKQGNKVKVKLTGFAIPSEDLIPKELRDKIINWSDYVDYWSVDWDYESLKSENKSSVFENNWQSFRTKKTPKLELETPRHQYDGAGQYSICVKAIDIFGNDTSKVVEVKIK